MGILTADFLIGCRHFAKSKRRDRLLSARREMADGGSTLYVRLCPPSSSGARRHPASWPCTLPPPRASSPSRRLYIYLVAVGLPSATMREGDDDAWGGDRGDTTRAGEETTRVGGRRAPEKTSAGKTARGGDDAGHTLTHECAPPSSDAGHLLFSSDVL